MVKCVFIAQLISRKSTLQACEKFMIWSADPRFEFFFDECYTKFTGLRKPYVRPPYSISIVYFIWHYISYPIPQVKKILLVSCGDERKRHKRYHCNVKWVQINSCPSASRGLQLTISPLFHSDLSARFVHSAQRAHNGLIAAPRRAREWVAARRSSPGAYIRVCIGATDRTQQRRSINRANCDCRRACAVGRGWEGGSVGLEKEKSPALFSMQSLWPGATWSHADCRRAARVQKSQQVGTSLGTESNWRQLCSRFLRAE